MGIKIAVHTMILHKETNVRRSAMNKMIKYIIVALLVLFSYSTAAADTESIRHEIEVFLSTGIGSIVSFILLFLFMLWLLLPLAVFGIKSKLKQLTRENGETNRLLADIKETYSIRIENNESNEILAHINETNKILADIRDELSVLKEEESPEANSEQSKTTVYEEDAGDLYDQIKYDP
jgi:hypothetical protein